MKRGLIFFLLILFLILITSCNKTVIKKVEPASDAKIVDETREQAPLASVVTEDRIKGVSLLYNKDMDIKYFKDLGFNTAFISVNGIRIAKPPYRTDLKLVRSFERVIQNFKNEKVNYVINILSGPGYSMDNSISTIFEHKQEAFYYAQMVRETIKLHIDDPYFKGVSLSFEAPNIDEEKYYNTLSYITSQIHEEYPDVNIIIGLHPLSFETGMENISKANFKNTTINAAISLKAVDYPSNGIGYNSSFKINRNSILSSLQILKDDLAKDNNVIVTIKSPWNKKSDVFLQDIFEIIRMLDFGFNLEYGNSQNSYDFKNTDEVIKIIKRHSK